MKQIWQKSPLIVHVTVLTLLLFGLSTFLLSSLTFFSNDTGLRFLQIRELIHTDWQSFAVRYPAQFLDPDLVHVPYYYAYLLLDGEFFLSITPFLPLLTSLFYAFIGKWALSIWPVAGGVLTAVALYKLGNLAGIRHSRLLLWVAIFTTPLFFYSLELWDHSIAVACATWATYGLALGVMKERWPPAAWGGVAAGIGLGQRPEMYVLAIALGIGLAIASWPRWRQWLAYVAGGVAGTLPIWFLQYRWIGHPFGAGVAPSLFKYGVPDTYPVTSYSGITITRPIVVGRLLLYVEARDPLTFSAALLVLIGAFLMIFALRVPRWRTRRRLWSGLALTLVGYGLYLVAAGANLLPGLLTTLPPFALALAYVEKADDPLPARRVYQLVFFSALAFLGLMLTLWPAFGGEQWGARYLLPAYPLLLFLSFYVVSVWQRPFPPITIAFACLLLIGLLIQLAGVRLLILKHQEQIGLKNTVANLPADLILTNSPFLPSFMAALDDKLFLYVDSDAEIKTLIPRMADHQIDRFALVLVTGRPLSVPAQVGDIALQEVRPFVYELKQPEP